MLLLLQIAHIDRVLGVCLIHCIGTAAGFMESMRDKVRQGAVLVTGVTL